MKISATVEKANVEVRNDAGEVVLSVVYDKYELKGDVSALLETIVALVMKAKSIDTFEIPSL